MKCIALKIGFVKGLTEEERQGLTATEVRDANRGRMKTPHLLLLAENK